MSKSKRSKRRILSYERWLELALANYHEKKRKRQAIARLNKWREEKFGKTPCVVTGTPPKKLVSTGDPFKVTQWAWRR